MIDLIQKLLTIGEREGVRYTPSRHQGLVTLATSDSNPDRENPPARYQPGATSKKTPDNQFATILAHRMANRA